MARVAAIRAGFNNGEVSPYMEGRVDWDKYPLSARDVTNMLVVTQGPGTKRDGTRFVAPVANEAYSSRLFEFEFSPTQGYAIELGADRARFFTNRGLVMEADKPVTAITQANPAVVTCTAHGYATGDQVRLTNVGPYAVLKNRTFNVAMIDANTFSIGFDGTTLPAFSGAPTVARIYSVPSPFAIADVPAISDLHSADVLTLTHGKYQPRNLTRSGATDWAMNKFVFKDGPYLTEDTGGVELLPADTGNAVPLMTSNTAPTGTAAAATILSTTYDAFKAFDRDPTTYCGLTGNTGVLEYDFAAGTTKVVDAYWITNTNDIGFAPSKWTFEGWTGTAWVVLDNRGSETGWAQKETRYYSFVNTVAYQKYRLNITGNDGGASTHIAGFGFHQSGDTQTPFALYAAATTSINDGQGFLSTDTDRTMRLMGSDGRWRWAVIDSVVSATQVMIRLYGQALPDTAAIIRWRLGLFSDTTGWPTCAAFYQNRQCFSGPPSYPNYVCFSVSNTDDTFTPSEDDGTVTEASGFAYPLVEQTVTAINWFQPMYRGLIIGTSEGEAIAQPMVTSFTTPAPFSALNIKVVWPTGYGSAPVRPRQVDTATLFVDRRATRVREMSYQLQEDTFVAPNMNAEADHITVGGITRICWQRHPNRVYWAARADGCLLGFTYEREQSVTAWHKHWIAGFAGANGVVEDCIVISSPDGHSEDLWLIVRRGANRYVEYIGDWFWHDTPQANACFVDSAVGYSGTPASAVAGLGHLEGQTVRVYADGVQQKDAVVTNGQITLAVAASVICVGLPYKARLETMRLNDGAQNGTAQGKMKRIYKFVLRLYRSFGGTVGDTQGRSMAIPCWPIQQSFMQPPVLMTGDTPALTFPGGWEQEGITVFENDTAYPFTIIAFMPQIITEDA